MKVGIYPGSFNPWHEGHTDILEKALKIFDKVIVAQGINPEKSQNWAQPSIPRQFKSKTSVKAFEGMLVDLVSEYKADAIIRGLRNGHDLQYEMNQQYWNEDLGMAVPTVYLICDRGLSHISSSAIKAVNKMKQKEGE